MEQKHATRNELAQAFIDMYLFLNFRVCGDTPVVDNPVVVNERATRAELRDEILNMKFQIKGLLYRYKELMDNEVDLNNRRCMKRMKNK